MNNKMNKVFVICCFFLTLSVSTSCLDANLSDDGIKLITAAEMKSILELENVKLIDVRTPSEFSGGHLDGAVNINFNDASFDTQIGQLDKSKPVFIYCQAGGRSGKAYKKMKAMGFEKVYDMEGGYGAYKAK